ncbi:hypothetical protein B0H13DRAFT_1865679 [Mycena leptocephala]|nr:hypothetical protein B0H13DRAFT_1865679 [Mycena leptocephala]
MSWLYSKLPRVNSENSAINESWHRQHGNTGSCVTQQYTLAKTEKGKDGNIHVTHSRSASDMFHKIGLTHTREDSDDIRRGIEFLRDRKILASLNSGSVESEGWHNQQRNIKLLAGIAKYKPLHRRNYEWIRVFHHPWVRENKINADRVPIATPLAYVATKMSRGLLWSAYSARNGLNNAAGTPTIILPLQSAPDMSQELGHGKLRERSEDTQKLCAYPAGLIKDAANYEPCYFSSGQLCNERIRYCPTISRDQREDIRSASCALLPRPFVDLDEYQTSGSWSLSVNLVLDAFRFVILLLPEQHHWRARCSENNLLLAGNNGPSSGRSEKRRDYKSAEAPPSSVKRRVFTRSAAGGIARVQSDRCSKPCINFGSINFGIESTLEVKDELFSQ